MLLRMLTGGSVLRRLVTVSVARWIEPDWKLKYVWYMFVPVITSIDLVCALYIPSTNQVYKPTGQHSIFLNRTERYHDALMYQWKVSCNIWSQGDFIIPRKTVVSQASHTWSTYWYILSQINFKTYIHCTYKYENPVLVHTKYILFICFRTDMYQYILGMSRYWYEHFRRVSSESESRVSGFQPETSGTLRYYDIIVFLWYHSLHYDIIVNIISMIS